MKASFDSHRARLNPDLPRYPIWHTQCSRSIRRDAAAWKACPLITLPVQLYRAEERVRHASRPKLIDAVDRGCAEHFWRQEGERVSVALDGQSLDGVTLLESVVLVRPLA